MRALEQNLATISAATAGTPLTADEGRALLRLAGLDPATVDAVVRALQRAVRSQPGAGRGRRRNQVATATRERYSTAAERGEPRIQRWASYADDYAMLARAGYPLDVIAPRLGLAYDALDKALEWHRDDPRARRPSVAQTV